MGSQSATCHPPEVTFPPLLQSAKDGTRFSNPEGMPSSVDLVDGLVTHTEVVYQLKTVTIPVLTGHNVL